MNKKTLVPVPGKALFTCGDLHVEKATMELAVDDYMEHGRSREEAFYELLETVNWKDSTTWHAPYYYEHVATYACWKYAVDKKRVPMAR